MCVSNDTHILITCTHTNLNKQADSPHVDADVWALVAEKKIPVMGICYGMQVSVKHTHTH